MVSALLAGSAQDLEHQERLDRLLSSARPRYAAQPTTSAGMFISELEALTGLPVLFGSHGPTHATVTERLILDYAICRTEPSSP